MFGTRIVPQRPKKTPGPSVCGFVEDCAIQIERTVVKIRHNLIELFDRRNVHLSKPHEPHNAWLQRRGANPLKLRRRKYHKKDAIAASAASHCSGSVDGSEAPRIIRILAKKSTAATIARTIREDDERNTERYPVDTSDWLPRVYEARNIRISFVVKCDIDFTARC